jgi:hypothetical protein
MSETYLSELKAAAEIYESCRQHGSVATLGKENRVPFFRGFCKQRNKKIDIYESCRFCLRKDLEPEKETVKSRRIKKGRSRQIEKEKSAGKKTDLNRFYRNLKEPSQKTDSPF